MGGVGAEVAVEEGVTVTEDLLPPHPGPSNLPRPATPPPGPAPTKEHPPASPPITQILKTARPPRR